MAQNTRVFSLCPFLEVVRAVLRNEHDLVIKTAENPDFLKRLFGSNDMHLLRKCPCPAWLMKPREKSNYNTIVAAVDFDLLSPTASEQSLNLEILELAASLALTDSASLHIVHAWEAFAERTMIEAILDQLTCSVLAVKPPGFTTPVKLDT